MHSSWRFQFSLSTLTWAVAGLAVACGCVWYPWIGIPLATLLVWLAAIRRDDWIWIVVTSLVGAGYALLQLLPRVQ